jgi:hypothetical protein
VAVVVEPAHQRVVDGERDVERGQACLNRCKVGCGISAVEVGDARRTGDDCRVGRPLRVEDAQRVLVERDLTLRRQ